MRLEMEALLELKEGEVYFVNVEKEEQSKVKEAINNFNAKDGFVTMDMHTGRELCNRLVPFCISVTAPFSAYGLHSKSMEFGFDACCVKCVIEPCILEGATVNNPCDPKGPPITGCEVAVNRVRAVGAIRAFLTLSSEPKCGNGVINAVNDETFCVNNVICFTCDDNACPDFCETRAVFTSTKLSNNSCGNKQLTVTGFFVLPQCESDCHPKKG